MLDVIASAINGGWDFLVMDEDWTEEVECAVWEAGYSVERSNIWRARICHAPDWEGVSPCRMVS